MYNIVYYAAYVLFGAATLLTIISGIVYLIQNKKVFAKE
jgi:phosphatidylglycerophosphate synthase